jgi:hypothetical protein
VERVLREIVVRRPPRTDAGLRGIVLHERLERVEPPGGKLETRERAAVGTKRAGIGQTPLPFYTVADPTAAATPTIACFPGVFPLPCESDANCFRLNCRGIDSTTGVGHCTDFCATDSDPTDPDSDCHKNAWIGQESFCATPANAKTGLCAPLIADGKPCQSANQCQSKLCQPAADGGTTTAGTCGASAP